MSNDPTRSANPEQLAGAFRTVVLFGAGFAAGRGLISKDNVQTIMSNFDVLLPAVVAIGTAIWGWIARKDKNLLVSAANVPTVEAVITSNSTLAENVPSEKVVTPTDARSLGIMGRY